MHENLKVFLALMGGLGGITTCLAIIITSSLSESSKEFAISVFLTAAVFLYGQAFYKRKDDEKAVKANGSSGGK